jgi:hypothetical protein
MQWIHRLVGVLRAFRLRSDLELFRLRLPRGRPPFDPTSPPPCLGDYPRVRTPAEQTRSRWSYRCGYGTTTRTCISRRLLHLCRRLRLLGAGAVAHDPQLFTELRYQGPNREPESATQTISGCVISWTPM